MTAFKSASVNIVASLKVSFSLKLKANFYDEDGVIIYSDESDIYADEFSGYDTIKISLHENNLAFNTVKCRIFVTRSIY